MKHAALSAGPSVTVIINTFNDARFLPEALDSVLQQTRPSDEIIVVDDGSTESPQALVDTYPGVRLIHQPNQGLAAARNTGLAAASGETILFLDADDRLTPNAIADGLACLAANPGSAMAYGAHRCTDAEWRPTTAERYFPMKNPPLNLLQGNPIGMHATALYRRDLLSELGGFDPGLRKCEDYDLYIRLANAHPISSHRNLTAEYRLHGGNISADSAAMLRSVLEVLEKHRPTRGAPDDVTRAWRRGQVNWRAWYAQEMMGNARRAQNQHGRSRQVLALKLKALMTAPKAIIRMMLKREKRRIWPPLGRVRLGDLGQTEPIDDEFGFGRGTPIDRGYIHQFLKRRAGDIRGRVLEIGDDEYSAMFGAGRIERQDILHVYAGNEKATLIGEIEAPGVLPANAFDCMVITQTLHLIFDMQAAVDAMFGALKPGGVLLLTVPGISRIDRGEWGANWFWSLTAASAQRLFEKTFGVENVEVESFGNVFAATAFLQGLALEEAPKAKLAVCDPAFPVIVAVRAIKPSNRA